MNSADRIANVGLLALCVVAWVGVFVLLTGFDPRSDTQVLLAGALLLGIAVAATLTALLWLAGFARQGRIAYRGDWWRASRRAALVGLVVTIFVLLRGQDALNLPLALFVVAMAALVELTLSLRR